jgi:cytidylate kinase
MSYNIGIDGMAGAGKDTVCKILNYVLNKLTEEKWDIIDSSAMYRTVGLFLEKHHKELGIPRITGLSLQEIKELGVAEVSWLEKAMEGITIDGRFHEYYACAYEGDITAKIEESYRYTGEGANVLKSPLGDEVSAKLGAIEKLRPYIVAEELRLAKDGAMIVPGRDSYMILQRLSVPVIGVYVYASAETRAKRRAEERKGDYKTILEEIRKRDIIDAARTEAPIRVPQSIGEADSLGYKVCIDNYEGRALEDIGFEAVKGVLDEMKVIVQDEYIVRLVKEVCENL